VFDIKVEVLLLIESQDFFENSRWHASRTISSTSSIKQSMKAELFILLTPSSEVTVTDAKNLCGLKPTDLSQSS
jgi:hypothetical protein